MCWYALATYRNYIMQKGPYVEMSVPRAQCIYLDLKLRSLEDNLKIASTGRNI